MPRIVVHGGGCCGIRTICGFGHTESYAASDINCVRTILHNRTSHCKGHLIEIVLNQNQIKGRLKPLLDMGFKFMTKFYNPTGMTCYVLHYCENARNSYTRAGRGIGKPLFGGPSPKVK